MTRFLFQFLAVLLDGDSLRTECDEKVMGLLLYKKEKLGNCQIRVVYRCKDARSNAGVLVRIDDGILQRLEENHHVRPRGQGCPPRAKVV